MQAWLCGSELNGGQVFGDGIRVPVGFGVRLGKNLMDAPGFWTGFEHLCVAILGNKQMSATPVVKNVHVVWRECGGLVQRLRGFFGLILCQADDSQPHPGGSVFRKRGGFLLNCGKSFTQLVKTKISNAEKEVCPMQ